jgi:hypothetical protein
MVAEECGGEEESTGERIEEHRLGEEVVEFILSLTCWSRLSY